MARNSSAGKSASKAVAKATGTSLANLDAQLASEVADLKDQIGQASSNRIKVEPAGAFVLPDGMDLGDEIQVVVVDFASHNRFYSTPYNPQNPAPPDCYAMGRKIPEMAPESDSPQIQADKCSTCPLNQYGSGNNGRSKACKNTRELAVILIDPENPEAAAALDAPIYSLSLPPTAIKSFDGAVAYIARTLVGPPVKAILTVRAKNAGTYAQITFSDPVPNPDYAVHASRREEVVDLLFRRPDFSAYEAKAPVRGRNAAPARRTAARR